MNKSINKKIVSVIPTTVVVTMFFVAQIFTRVQCSGVGDCGWEWMWLLLWPVFLILLIVSLVFMAIYLVATSKK